MTNQRVINLFFLCILYQFHFQDELRNRSDSPASCNKVRVRVHGAVDVWIVLSERYKHVKQRVKSTLVSLEGNSHTLRG